MAVKNTSNSPPEIGAKETGTPGVFIQDTFKVNYRNGFEKKKQLLAIKRKEAAEIAAKKLAVPNAMR